jgi:hypothetical protein
MDSLLNKVSEELAKPAQERGHVGYSLQDCPSPLGPTIHFHVPVRLGVSSLRFWSCFDLILVWYSFIPPFGDGYVYPVLSLPLYVGNNCFSIL